MREGCWYFEVTVQHLGETGHARVGWCTKKADVQAPTGADAHGFAYRDLEVRVTPHYHTERDRNDWHERLDGSSSSAVGCFTPCIVFPAAF